MLIALDIIPTRNRDINVVKYFPNLKKKKKKVSPYLSSHILRIYLLEHVYF